MHRLLVPDLATLRAPSIIAVSGEEAHHAARAKRLQPGDAVELLDGRGRRATARFAESVKLGNRHGWEVRLEIDEIAESPRPMHGLVVRSAVPKGPRLEHMIDQLSQIGVGAWSPLISTRAVVDPRRGKLDRLERVCLEAVKQSGRAWAMRIEASVAARSLPITSGVIVADRSGDPLGAVGPTGEDLTLLIGPEGGWTPDELERFRSGGARIVSFGPHVMRIETAAVVAAGVLLQVAWGLGG